MSLLKLPQNRIKSAQKSDRGGTWEGHKKARNPLIAKGLRGCVSLTKKMHIEVLRHKCFNHEIELCSKKYVWWQSRYSQSEPCKILLQQIQIQYQQYSDLQFQICE